MRSLIPSRKAFSRRFASCSAKDPIAMPTLQPPTRLRLLFCLAALSVASGCARSSEGVSGEREKPRYEPKKDPSADEALKKAEAIAKVNRKPKPAADHLNR